MIELGQFSAISLVIMTGSRNLRKLMEGPSKRAPSLAENSSNDTADKQSAETYGIDDG